MTSRSSSTTWGGPIGLPWAARRPDAIRGLFLLNTFAPTLPVLFGEDVLTPWHQLFPHAQVHRLSDCHFVPEDAPQELLGELRDFARS
ncbi:MAG: hypothetical protein M3376_04835 [Actinomycetota bacterium]|nr:hypothetical protein [Actinomycetota bacterium]